MTSTHTNTCKRPGSHMPGVNRFTSGTPRAMDPANTTKAPKAVGRCPFVCIDRPDRGIHRRRSPDLVHARL
ncbi:MAG: hypothetical protein KF699_16880 [Phycisphaeraceae bacterium]|nr:hypothetical protein [Phycisphaeraceae bacterium]